jgi:hypothetical protein
MPLPAFWCARQRLRGRAVEVRRFLLRRFPYKLFATVSPDAMVFVAIARGSRAPDYWRARMP